MKRIILASGSPRRKMLMEWAEITFEIIVSDIDESFPDDLNPVDVALFIAKNKNKAVFESMETEDDKTDALVISADTIVVLNDEIIGKPLNRDHAIQILQKLSGQKHAVITALKLFTKYELRVGEEYWLGRVFNTFKRPEPRRMASCFGNVELNVHAPLNMAA